jgi:hypothetical protein
MATRCTNRSGTWLGLATLCLWAVCATASSVGAQPDKADPPNPLPEDIVQAWEDAGATFGWMGLTEYGMPFFVPFFAAKAARLTSPVPAFRFVRWEDG